MSEKELLEMAAKAAGITGNRDSDGGYVYHQRGSNKPGDIWVVKWNPLTDDGDALRLAVKLGLDIDIHRRSPLSDSCGTEIRGYAYRRNMVTEPASDNDESLEAATRRAIVRAAAEIGKGI